MERDSGGLTENIQTKIKIDGLDDLVQCDNYSMSNTTHYTVIE